MTEEPFESNDNNNSQESSASTTSEPSPDQKREISGWVADGMGLSDIQKKINTDFGIVMTYMDVRFLVDDLNLTLVDEEEEAKPEDPEAGTDAASALLHALPRHHQARLVFQTAIIFPRDCHHGNHHAGDQEIQPFVLGEKSKAILNVSYHV